MSFINKKIGIWGFGVVGKAALKFFSNYTANLTIMDKKELSDEDLILLKRYKAHVIPETNNSDFFIDNDLIIPSPGINTQPYHAYRHKFITELDIIQQLFTKPIVAITGTVGKTSITHILSTLIAHHMPIVTGGNIGVGMLELIEKQDECSMMFLEVSSFQLEHCTCFAPQLAIWTNFYPNHLDRHQSLEEYFKAKATIIAHQNESQSALIPIELASHVNNMHYKSRIHFFSPEKPTDTLLHTMPAMSMIFWIQENNIVCFSKKTVKKIAPLHTEGTFSINWLIIQAALYILNLPQPTTTQITIPEHRIEKIESANNIEFYNDSKSTIMESTIAAVNKLQSKPIILLLGGLSKGADRSSKIKELQHKVTYIITFGTESSLLHHAAQQHNIPCISVNTLDQAVNHAYSIACPGDQIILSPGGSSYDQFTDYKARGAHFKKIVQTLIT